MKIRVNIVNAFVDGEVGGNPAGVVLDADALTARQKQHIAATVGRSETAFVSRSDTADVKLEFFTPTRQIAHCGHATIAAFSYLKQLGRIRSDRSSKETIDGNRDILFEGAAAFMAQTAPRYQEVRDDTDEILHSLELSGSDLLRDRTPLIVNTGNRFLIVPLKSLEALAMASPDMKALIQVSERFDLIGYYLFAPDSRVKGRDADTRMFAPRYGIPEESATGTAAGPLGCYLHDRLGLQKDAFLIEQGHFMETPSPSVLTVRLHLKDGSITGLMAGGRAKRMGELDVEI